VWTGGSSGSVLRPVMEVVTAPVGDPLLWVSWPGRRENFECLPSNRPARRRSGKDPGVGGFGFGDDLCHPRLPRKRTPRRNVSGMRAR
jgi:hypothetical protein